jgi:hypothetical protein
VGPLGKVAAVVGVVETGGAEGLIALGAVQWNAGVPVGLEGEPTARAINSGGLDVGLAAGARQHREKIKKRGRMRAICWQGQPWTPGIVDGQANVVVSLMPIS